MNRRFVPSLGRSFAVVAAAATLLAAMLGVVFVVGMRTKSPTVQGAVRRVNKAFFNPRSMETAGTPGAYASVVRHVGRSSGAAYETPVVPVRVGDDFIIALPYGTAADWVQNVLAAGRATITHEGETYAVERPEVVTTELVGVHFAEQERKAHQALAVDECLLLRGVVDGL